MSTLKGISHIAFATGDLERTIRFWRDLVGLRMILSLGRTGAKMYFFSIAERQYLGFFEWPGILPVEEKEAGYPTTGRLAFDHFSIALQKDDDLWEMKSRLEAAGFWVSEAIDHGFIHSIYTFDPNGIALEFSVDTEVDLVSHPHFGDTSPCKAALEGPEPRPDAWPRPETPPHEERILRPGVGDFLGRQRRT